MFSKKINLANSIYLATCNGRYLLKTNRGVECFNDKNERLWANADLKGVFYEVGDAYFFSTQKTTQAIDFDNGKIIKQLDFSIDFTDGHFLIGHDIIEFPPTLQIYNVDGSKKFSTQYVLGKFRLAENNFVNFTTLDEKTFAQQEHLFISINLADFIIRPFVLFEAYSAEELNSALQVKITKMVGIWKDQIILALNNSHIVSYNLCNGNLEKEWHKIEGFILDSDNKGVIPKPESFVLDVNNNILIGAINTFYFEIDLLIEKIKCFDLKTELSMFNIHFIKQVSNNPFTDEHLFLTAMKKQSLNDEKWSSDCLIAFNRKTHKIDWHYSFENASLGTNVPQISENKLFQLDSNNTLHIFEKTT